MEKRIQLLNERISKLDEKFAMFQKEYKFTVYKKWVTQPGEVSKITGEVPAVCPFCSEMEGLEVPFHKLWTHPTHTKYNKLKPGPTTHKGCRCTFDIVIR